MKRAASLHKAPAPLRLAVAAALGLSLIHI